MRERIIKALVTVMAVALIPAQATAYCIKGTTASGEPTRLGICAGGNAYFGKTISLYQRLPDGSVGKHLGTFDCKDKGGTDAIRNNAVIDVWRPDLDACQEFMHLVYEDGCKGRIYVKVGD